MGKHDVHCTPPPLPPIFSVRFLVLILIHMVLNPYDWIMNNIVYLQQISGNLEL